MKAFKTVTVLDTHDDRTEVTARAGVLGPRVMMESHVHDDWTVQYFTPDQARELADALRVAAQEAEKEAGQ